MTKPAPKHKLLVLAVAGVAVVQLSVLWMLREDVRRGKPDFSGFYGAGRIVLTGNGRNLYDLGVQGKSQAQFTSHADDRTGPLPFNHAPFETLVFAPLALFPYEQAFVVWYICNLTMLLSIPFLLRRELSSLLQDRFHWIIVAFGAFLPANVALVQGQDSILLTLLLALSYVAFKRGKFIGVGFFLALGTFKPHIILLPLLAFLITHHWRVLAGFTGTVCFLLFVSTGLVGWQGVLRYPSFLLLFNRLPFDVAAVYPDRMANVRGFVHVLLAGRIPPRIELTVSALITGILILVLVAVWLQFRGNEKLPGSHTARLDLSLSLFMVVTCAAAYHVYTHDLSLLMLPFLLVANYLTQATSAYRPWRHALLTVSLTLLFLTPFGISLPYGAVAIFCAELLFIVGLFLTIVNANNDALALPARSG